MGVFMFFELYKVTKSRKVSQLLNLIRVSKLEENCCTYTSYELVSLLSGQLKTKTLLILKYQFFLIRELRLCEYQKKEKFS